MYINELAKDTPLQITVLIQGKKVNFDTTVLKVYKEPYHENVFCVGCAPIVVENHLVNFGKKALTAKVKNVGDNRDYKFNIDMHGFNKDKSQLLLFSKDFAKPVNYRTSYRVSCNLQVKVQIGDNKKQIEGYVHDISYAGLGLLFLSRAFPSIETDMPVRAEFVDSEHHLYKVNGTIVRVKENFVDNKTLVGVKLDNPPDTISKLINRLQRNECKVRKRKN